MTRIWLAVVPSVLAAGCLEVPDTGGGEVQLLSDSGFEEGSSRWTMYGNPVYRLGQLPNEPFEGEFAARFGGANSKSRWMRQRITIPADATWLVVRGVWCAVNDDGQEGGADQLMATLSDASGTFLDGIAIRPNVAATSCEWTPFEFSLGSPHAGEQLEFGLNGQTDEAGLTSFYVDSLEVLTGDGTLP